METNLKSSDLRIGNLVTENTYGVKRNGTIKAIRDKQIVLRLEHSVLATSIKNIEPIPLTEEWLLKFGFRTEEPYSFELDNISINTKRDLMWIFTKCKNNVEVDLTEYVHELQNLYFALIQRELTVA